MKYDFDTPVDRKGTNSLKWDEFPNSIPMWVADMDFKTAPEIINALSKRVEHGVFGYTYPGERWAKSYVDFWNDRYGFKMEEDWLVFALGVVPILSSSVRALTAVGDEVIIMPPVYNIFYNSIRNNGREVVEVPLIEKDGGYSIDFPALEKAFSSDKAKLMIFCNPENPVAKIWSGEELRKVGELSNRYGVIVLSDEIHCPLTRPGKDYVPYLSIESNRKNGFAAISPTKAFNLAGIHTACASIPNPEIKKKVERQMNTDEVAEPNVFSAIASSTALDEGREWLDELRVYLFENRDFACDFINEKMPRFHALDGDATYLMWVKLPKAKEFVDFLFEKHGVKVSHGDVYGGDGDTHFRLNVACPRSQLENGLNKMLQAYSEFDFD